MYTSLVGVKCRDIKSHGNNHNTQFSPHVQCYAPRALSPCNVIR